MKTCETAKSQELKYGIAPFFLYIYSLFILFLALISHSFVKHGQKDIFDLHKKEKKPEDIGFPEYSRKFLKRNLRVINMPEELQR